MRSTLEVARSAGQVDEDYGIIEDISISATSVIVLRGIRKSACFSILGHSAYGRSHSRQIRVCRYTYIAILVWGIWKSEHFSIRATPHRSRVGVAAFSRDGSSLASTLSATMHDR